jgi:fermentation-respiration switch protein FrsA (DUF1100 family)
MSGAAVAESGEPLALWMREAEPRGGGLRAQRFEYSSRGDRVPGLLLLPRDVRPPFPLVLLQHGAGGSKESAYLDAARLPWVRGGAAVASVDFPLHGERANAKLGERFFAALADRRAGKLDARGAALWSDFARQAMHDLARALDALGTLPEIDASRIAYAAFSLGAIVGGLFCPTDPRLCAAALALGGAGFGPPALDPAHALRGFAGRPLLFVNATRDETISRASAEALHAAAPHPKEIAWFESGHTDLPGSALKAMWIFLARELRIGSAEGA